MAAGDDAGAAAACPIDHRPRDACPVDHSSSSSNNKPPEACPVDHKSREVWLSQARAAAAAAPSPTARPPPSNAPAPAPSWNPLTWRVPFLSTSSPAQSATQPPTPPPSTRSGHLDEARVVSSIPRAVPSPSPSPSPTAAAAIPSNHENETGADAATGNWVYPSEKMFFEALRRKGSAGGPDGARAADMRTVVPIHNAVNERAWREIKAWEAPYCGGGGGGVAAGAACPGGPRLESFSGLAAKMSPRARINTWLGYTAPFDRHDWVVDRCGVRVEYVIDFYAGRPGGPAGATAPQKLNFYLDVRPKLNTWEGVKMRALRALGIV